MLLVSNKTQLRLSLEKFIEDPKKEHQDKMYQILLDSKSSISGFREITVLTLDQKIVASTNLEEIGREYSELELSDLTQNKNYFGGLHTHENQALEVHFSAPLIKDEKLLGFLVIDSNLDNIFSLLKDYSGLGITGETLLAKRDENGDALFFVPLRFDPEAAFKRIVSKEAKSVPITQALLKNETLFTDAVDYRGELVLGANDFTTKPLMIEDIVPRVRRYVG